jgi:hypothetical protein
MPVFLHFLDCKQTDCVTANSTVIISVARLLGTNEGLRRTRRGLYSVRHQSEPLKKLMEWTTCAIYAFIWRCIELIIIIIHASSRLMLAGCFIPSEGLVLVPLICLNCFLKL